MSLRLEDKDGAERWSWTKASVGSRISARTTRFHKETACSVKKKFYINDNIKMNKAYQSLPFLRSTLKIS
jgi:hypothetical protein